MKKDGHLSVLLICGEISPANIPLIYSLFIALRGEVGYLIGQRTPEKGGAEDEARPDSP